MLTIEELAQTATAGTFLRSVGQNQEAAWSLGPAKHLEQELARVDVAPLQVVDGDDELACFAQPEQDARKRAVRALPQGAHVAHGRDTTRDATNGRDAGQF